MDEAIVLKTSDHIAQLRFNQPHNYNALDEKLLVLFQQKIRSVSNDPTIRALVISSTSQKAFVSGADIAYMRNNSPEKAEWFCDLGFWAFQTLQELPVPVIAAISGHCLGGGLELAMACDLRVASSRAKFGYPEVKLGILPGWGGLSRTAAATGLSRAKELMFTGRIIPASEALEYHLVDRVVEPEQLEQTCMELARSIAVNAPLPVRLIKQNIVKASVASPEEANAIADRAMGLCFSSEDQREGMQAFLEKRPPVFRGK